MWGSVLTWKALVVMSIVFVSTSVSAPFAAADQVHNDSSYSIRINLSFDPGRVSFETQDGYDRLLLPNCRLTTSVGEPMLPVKDVFVAVPDSSEVQRIRIVSQKTRVLSGRYDILPAQPPAPTMAGDGATTAAEFVPPGPVYRSSEPYPGRLYGGANVGSMRGHDILSFSVFPVQYNPITRRLTLYEEIALEVAYTVPQRYSAAGSAGVAGVAAAVPESEQDEFYRIAERLVVNPDDISRAKSAVVAESFCATVGSGLEPDPKFEYVIITDSSLESEFLRLADWKTRKGVPATVVNTSWIDGSYDGNDTQDEIRKFIADACATWDTKWVLLGGDTNIIPCRCGHGWVDDGTSSGCTRSIPADLYYSDLDRDWNADGDAIYGEVSDNIDLYPDVFVGRASVDTIAEAEVFVEKTLRYERSPPADYATDILFLAEYLYGPANDGGKTKDLINNDSIPDHFNVTKLYERHGNLNKSSAMAHLNLGCNIVNHIGHGSTDGFSVASGTIKNDDADNLINSPRNFILYSISCYSNNFEDNSVSEHFMNNADGGAVGYIGNSRYGWYWPGHPSEGPSDLYDMEFFNKTFTTGAYHLGGALAASKVTYIPMSREDGDAMRWLQYAINLLGDPELPILTDSPKTFAVGQPSAVPACSSCGCQQTVTITVSEDGSGAPVPNATVCVQKVDDGTYAVELTDAAGNAEFSIAPDVGVLNVTVTKQNFVVHEGTLNVVPCGDVDESGVVGIADVRLLLSHIFDSGGYPITESIGDVDCNDVVNIPDARLLLNHVSDPGGYPI